MSGNPADQAFIGITMLLAGARPGRMVRHPVASTRSSARSYLYLDGQNMGTADAYYQQA